MTRIILTAGKHYYNLLEKRKSLGVLDTAIIRLESFCPFPTLQLTAELDRFSNAKTVIWCQEEPRNMGAWSFMKPRFENLIGRKVGLIVRCNKVFNVSFRLSIVEERHQRRPRWVLENSTNRKWRKFSRNHSPRQILTVYNQ